MRLLLFAWVIRCSFLLSIVNGQNNAYNARNFGATGNGRTDDTQVSSSPAINLDKHRLLLAYIRTFGFFSFIYRRLCRCGRRDVQLPEM